MHKVRSLTVKVTQEGYAVMLGYLFAHRQATTEELAEVSGLAPVTVRNLFRTLKRHGVAHIAAWHPDAWGRDAFVVWGLGPGKDAPRRRKSTAEICRDYRERKKRRAVDAALGFVPS